MSQGKTPPALRPLYYFPQIYDDELLYSVIARYHHHVGNVSSTHTAQDLFGKRTQKLSIPLPVDLDSLAARIAPERGLDGRTLAETTTHYNYYAAYRSAAAAEVGMVQIRQFGGSPQFALGTATFLIRPPQTLRFCAECLEGMFNDRGEAWWRRDQQLPGVVVCPQHGIILQDSSASTLRRAAYTLTRASRLNCTASSPPVVICSDPATLESLQRFAKASAALLTAPQRLMPPAVRAEAYRDELIRLSVSPDRWHVYIPRLAQLIRAQFGPGMAFLSSELVGEGFERGLAGITRRSNVGRHPIYHLLMESFLRERSVVAVELEQSSINCPNRLCTFTLQPAAKIISSRREIGKRVRIYECPCGYSFYYSVTDCGKPPRPRLRCFGPTLDPALTKLVADGVGLKAAMLATGLHARALAVAAARLSLPVKWKLPAVVGVSIGQTKLRPLRSKRNRPPPPRKKRIHGPVRRWPVIDELWASKLPMAAEAILARTPPERVTRAELERQMGQPGYLDTRKAKLPLTYSRILSLMEPVERFQARRVAFEIAKVKEKSETPKRWEILRAARIRTLSPEVEDALSGIY